MGCSADSPNRPGAPATPTQVRSGPSSGNAAALPGQPRWIEGAGRGWRVVRSQVGLDEADFDYGEEHVTFAGAGDGAAPWWWGYPSVARLAAVRIFGLCRHRCGAGRRAVGVGPSAAGRRHCWAEKVILDRRRGRRGQADEEVATPKCQRDVAAWKADADQGELGLAGPLVRSHFMPDTHLKVHLISTTSFDWESDMVRGTGPAAHSTAIRKQRHSDPLLVLPGHCLAFPHTHTHISFFFIGWGKKAPLQVLLIPQFSALR